MDLAEKHFYLLYNFHSEVVRLNRLKDLRLQKRMKQADLAKLLNCSPTTISNYEVGLRDIDSATICRFCEIFGCTADYLLGRSAVQSAELTPEEEQLLTAFRRGDDRARDMVRLALDPFREENSSAEAI